MQVVWTLACYPWKNLLPFMSQNSAGFHWTFHFHFPFPLRKVEYQPNYFILWTIADCELWWFDIFDSSMLRDGCFSSCCRREWDEENFTFRASMLYHWATETLWWAKSITRFIHDALPGLPPDKNHLSLFLHHAQNLTISLILFTRMTLLTSLILAVRGTRVIHEFRNGPRSP